MKAKTPVTEKHHQLPTLYSYSEHNKQQAEFKYSST